MKSNIGSADRLLRIVAGVVALAAGVYYKSWWGLLGIVPIATAIIRFCPLYCPLRISTNSNK